MQIDDGQVTKSKETPEMEEGGEKKRDVDEEVTPETPEKSGMEEGSEEDKVEKEKNSESDEEVEEDQNSKSNEEVEEDQNSNSNDSKNDDSNPMRIVENHINYDNLEKGNINLFSSSFLLN